MYVGHLDELYCALHEGNALGDFRFLKDFNLRITVSGQVSTGLI